MTISIKKEIDLIALLALMISGIALWLSYQSTDGHIVKGGGRVLVHPYIDRSCQMLVSIPVSYHNSGKRAVSLQRFIPAEDVPSIIFLKNKEIIKEVVSYKLHIFEEKVLTPTHMFNLLETTPEYSLESYRYLDILIKPGDTFEASFVITAQDHINGKKLFDDVMVAIGTEFSNGQVIEHRSAINLETDSLRVCGS